ncbi:MAG: DUF4910 domain-containing protein, partial [Candidatus Thorarchaeota archaeon]
MDFDKLIDNVLSEINGQRAWDWIAQISQYNRIQASNGYHEILEVIKKELEVIGFNKIEHFRSPADGEKSTWDYIAPYQWELESGSLEIISPKKLKLCDSSDLIVSIITHSKTCDVISEVVDIGVGDKEEDYPEELVKGKIALMSGTISMYRSFLENSKALGAISYPDLKRTGDQLDKVIYNGFFTTKDRLDKAKFGFSISYNQAQHIKELLKQGPVKVHAKINSQFKEGNLENLSTCINGIESPDKEIIIISHLCHPKPGANDNASGAAGLLELARIFKKMVEKGSLKPPKYTIRFIWVPEINGTVPWMKYHKEHVKNAIACLNLDMIGEHRLRIGYPLQVNLSPHSNPSILNDITRIIVKKVADHPKGVSINGSKVPMSYRLTAYEGGSDHILFNDFYFSIPAIMFGHDDPYYHSSMDTIEYCDPTEMKRVIGMALSVSYIFSLMDDGTILSLWSIIHEGLLIRCSSVIKLLEDIHQMLNEAANKEEVIRKAELQILCIDILKTFYEYEINLLNWIKKYVISKELTEKYHSIKREISQIFEFQKDYWQKVIKSFTNNNEIFDLRFDYQATFKPNFEGPVL